MLRMELGSCPERLRDIRRRMIAADLNPIHTISAPPRLRVNKPAFSRRDDGQPFSLYRCKQHQFEKSICD